MLLGSIAFNIGVFFNIYALIKQTRKLDHTIRLLHYLYILYIKTECDID